MENKKLMEAVLEWWESHQYDCASQDAGNGYSEEYNLYNEEPEFVKIAKEMKEKLEVKQE